MSDGFISLLRFGLAVFMIMMLIIVILSVISYLIIHKIFAVSLRKHAEKDIERLKTNFGIYLVEENGEYKVISDTPREDVE